MKDKKNPQRFSIQFDQSIPEHRAVIEMLLSKGRFASRYIADAILFYENSKSDSLESTVAQVVTKMLGLNNLPSELNLKSESSDNSFDFEEIADDLDCFKKL